MERAAQPIHKVLFNVGTLTLSSLAAASVFMLGFDGGFGELVTVAAGLAAGAAYFAVNTGLLSVALAIEGRENVLARLARALPLARRRTTSSTASSAA